MRTLGAMAVLFMFAMSACRADGLVRRRHRARRVHKVHKKEKPHVLTQAECLETYPEPERSWIKNHTWVVVGNEFDELYHRPCCPLMMQTDARRLLGWSSPTEARNVGRKPCPICKPVDPATTPQGRMRTLFEKSASALRMAQQVGSMGFISQAADYWQVGWIARGDAFMIAGDQEKARGRIENARALYREAGKAYSRASIYLPPVPAPGATPANTGGMSLPSGLLGTMGTGGGYGGMGNFSVVSGAMGGVAIP